MKRSSMRQRFESTRCGTTRLDSSGLRAVWGQGLGYALGVKLALPKRTVVMTIGDGSFMYNPVVPAIAFADEHKLPLAEFSIFNNAKYAAMQYFPRQVLSVRHGDRDQRLLRSQHQGA